MTRDNQTVTSIALIGSGYWGKNLARNFNDLGALASICETDPDLRSKLQEQYPDCNSVSTIEDVLADKANGAVAIATPAETHYELVRQCLAAGKDVFVEKPLALCSAHGEELVAMAEEADRILMVGHLLWYHPAVLKLKSLIRDGELGRIRYIYSNRLNLGKIRREENILWSFAPHDISVILGLLDEAPCAVHAQGGNYLHQQIADVTVSTLAFPSGVRAHVFVSWLHPFKEQKLVVVGDEKMAVLDDMEKEDKLVLYPHTIDWKDHLPVANKAEGEPVPIEMDEPLRAECAHFLDCVRTRQSPRTDGAEALRVLNVLEQCQKSLSTDYGNDKEHDLAYYAHDTAVIDKGTSIGDGTKIWHFSHVMTGSTVGNNCRVGQNVVIGPNATVGNSVKIQNNVSVYEGVTIEDNVFCGPSIVFTNVFNPRSEIPRMSELRPTLVREGATLGANCTIVCGNTVGKYAFIGAGAVVTKNVPDYALVSGVPGRHVGWMCKCGLKLTFKNGHATCTCGELYTKTESGIVPAAP